MYILCNSKCPSCDTSSWHVIVLHFMWFVLTRVPTLDGREKRPPAGTDGGKREGQTRVSLSVRRVYKSRPRWCVVASAVVQYKLPNA